MRLFFAGVFEGRHNRLFDRGFFKSVCVLSSYFYVRNKVPGDKDFYPNDCYDFMLDSGGFSFIANNKTGAGINWKEYIRHYANFINRWNIKKFIELDIDNLVGYERVKDYRKMLEDLTGKPAIPVFHPTRTYDDFAVDCAEHRFVALGMYEKLNTEVSKKLIEIAHENNSRVHRLGITNINEMIKRDIVFDSCDSITWLSANRFGQRLNFNRQTGFAKLCQVEHKEQLKPTWRESAYSLATWGIYSHWLGKNLSPVWDEDAKGMPVIEEDSMTDDEIRDRYATRQRA